MSSGGWARLAALGLAAASACLGVTGALSMGAAAPAGGAPARAASRARATTAATAGDTPSHHKGPDLVLDGQSQWVVAPATGGVATFDVDLHARRAPAGATVQAVLYSRLNTRDGFESTVKNGPHGYPLSRTVPVPYAGLPATPRGEPGSRLAISVTTVGWTGSGTKIGLDCGPPTRSGTCTGVYPVDIELRGPRGATLAHLTTFLTYGTRASAHPLDVAWVVPLEAPIHIDTTTTKPTAALGAIGPGAAGALERLVAQLRAAGGVPVTLDASPETLQALARGSAGRAADAALAAMSANQARTEVLPSPYVPIDLGALAGSKEPAEISRQMAAGATALRKLGIRTTAPPTWVTTAPVGSSTLGGLHRAGAGALVVSSTALSPTPTPVAGTWASTFRLRLGTRPAVRARAAPGARTAAGTTVLAAESDAWLDGQFTAHPRDPALAASQLLADLAMVHFERPNTVAVRGMIAMPPSGWTPNATFDRVLLAGLHANPDVAPVTLATFLRHVTRDGTRTTKAAGKTPGPGHSIAAGLPSARAHLRAFAEAILGHPPIKAQLTHLLLATETAGLSHRARGAAIAEFRRVLRQQMAQITVDTGRSFTLTSSTGVIPVTVNSAAPYTVVGTVSVSGSKFVFPHDAAKATFRLDHATNSWRVDVKARTSGDSALHVAFTTPDGDLVIASGTLVVRSTATTVVGIVLTVIALAILFLWWARTWWNGRRRKRLAATAGDDGT